MTWRPVVEGDAGAQNAEPSQSRDVGADRRRLERGGTLLERVEHLASMTPWSSRSAQFRDCFARCQGVPEVGASRFAQVPVKSVVDAGGMTAVASAIPPPVVGGATWSRDAWQRVRLLLILTYVVAYVVWLLEVGLIIDRISVLTSVAILLLIANVGRSRRMWRLLGVDFVLYVAMWIAYDETRGAADRVGMPLQVESVRNVDRFLFGGADPNVWLQDRFFSPDHVRWYDVLASVLYYSHFIVPVAVIVILWVRSRPEWVRFMRRFATVLAIGCVSFVLLPTAPPWMAAGGSRSIPLHALPSLERPVARGWAALNVDSFIHAWETGRDWVNPVAAIPSLHAAFSLFVVVFWFPSIRRRWVRAVLLAYPLLMGCALVYLAEHWVIDLVAGWAVVGASFAIWGAIERRVTRRRADAVEADDVHETDGGADHAGAQAWTSQPA